MKNSISNINKKIDIGMVIYMFIFLFEPPLIPKIRGLIYLTLYSCIVLMYRYKNSYKNVWKHSGMTTWLFGMILFFCYTIIVICMNMIIFDDVVQIGHYIRTYGRYFMLIISVFCCSTYLILECERKNYTTEELIGVILYAGVIQGICAASALLVPDVKKIFIKMSSVDMESSIALSGFYSLRAYGFSKNLVDGFGFGTGIIAGLACILGQKNKKYMILSIFLLLTPLLNSRTGLVIYIIAIAIYILGLIWNHKMFEVIKMLVVVFGCVIISIQFYHFLSELKPELVGWVENGMNGFFSVIKREKVSGGSMAVLMQDSWWKLPEGGRLLIGTGHTRYEAEGYVHTDVGYVNDIWFSGILGIILLYGSIVQIFYKTFLKVDQKIDKLIVLFLLASLIVFNVKSCAISYYPGTAIIFTILWMYIYQRNKNKKE